MTSPFANAWFVVVLWSNQVVIILQCMQETQSVWTSRQRPTHSLTFVSNSSCSASVTKKGLCPIEVVLHCILQCVLWQGRTFLVKQKCAAQICCFLQSGISVGLSAEPPLVRPVGFRKSKGLNKKGGRIVRHPNSQFSLSHSDALTEDVNFLSCLNQSQSNKENINLLCQAPSKSSFWFFLTQHHSLPCQQLLCHLLFSERACFFFLNWTCQGEIVVIEFSTRLGILCRSTIFSHFQIDVVHFQISIRLKLPFISLWAAKSPSLK